MTLLETVGCSMGEPRKRAEQPAIRCDRGEDHARECAQPEAQVVGLHGLRCECDALGEGAVRVHIHMGWLRLRRQHLHGRRDVETEPEERHQHHSRGDGDAHPVPSHSRRGGRFAAVGDLQSRIRGRLEPLHGRIRLVLLVGLAPFRRRHHVRHRLPRVRVRPPTALIIF
jgi:hypothetical protein